jgi:ligand-binding SRPBCC domain-containing protein
VAPVAGIKTRWVSEITHVKPKEYFVDEQRVGPYRMWHHQHFVSQLKNSTLMTDIVSYQPPFGIIGSLANRILISGKLDEIFDYRTSVLSDLFGTV